MKRLLKAIPVLLASALVLVGCGTVDATVDIKNPDDVDVSIQADSTKEQMQQFAQSQSQGGAPATEVTPGSLLQGQLSSIRQQLQIAAPSAWDITEENHGDKRSAHAELKGLTLQQVSQAMGQGLTYDQDHYTFALPKLAPGNLAGASFTLTVQFPQPVVNATAGGEISGNSVTWNLGDALQSGEPVMAETGQPTGIAAMPWWLNALIFALGVIVVGLLISIAVMPRRRETDVTPAQAFAEEDPSGREEVVFTPADAQQIETEAGDLALPGEEVPQDPDSAGPQRPQA